MYHFQRSGLFEVWKDSRYIPGTEMGNDDLREYFAEVCRQRKVSTLVKLFWRQTRPLPVYLAPFDRTTRHEKAAGVAMVRSSGAVLADCPAKFGHRYEDDVAHAVPQITI